MSDESRIRHLPPDGDHPEPRRTADRSSLVSAVAVIAAIGVFVLAGRPHATPTAVPSPTTVPPGLAAEAGPPAPTTTIPTLRQLGRGIEEISWIQRDGDRTDLVLWRADDTAPIAEVLPGIPETVAFEPAGTRTVLVEGGGALWTTGELASLKDEPVAYHVTSAVWGGDGTPFAIAAVVDPHVFGDADADTTLLTLLPNGGDRTEVTTIPRDAELLSWTGTGFVLALPDDRLLALGADGTPVAAASGRVLATGGGYTLIEAMPSTIPPPIDDVPFVSLPDGIVVVDAQLQPIDVSITGFDRSDRPEVVISDDGRRIALSFVMPGERTSITVVGTDRAVTTVVSAPRAARPIGFVAHNRYVALQTLDDKELLLVDARSGTLIALPTLGKRIVAVDAR